MATVLLAEDEDDAAEPLAKALRRAGHKVLSVSAGHDAVAVAVLHGADLLITDLRMPGMDGAEVLSALRADRRFEALPVLVFSAYAEGRDGERLRGLNVSQVFLKGSTDLADIVAAVGRHVGHSHDPNQS